MVKKCLSAVALCFLVSHAVFAVDIQINGLKKTRESYLRQVLAKYNDIPAAELDLNDVETTLQEQGLFSSIEAYLDYNDQNNIALVINVAEKISFLPIPFAMYSSNTGFMGGLMVMDTNAFGVKDNYVVGGIFSKSMQMGVTSFTKPSLGRTQPGFSVSGSFAHRKNELEDSHEDTVLSYRTIGGSVSASVSDKLTEHVTVQAGVRYQYTHISLGDEYESYGDTLKTSHACSVNGSTRVNFAALNEWFLSNRTATLGAEMTFFSTGKKAPSLNGQIALQQPLPVSRLRLLATVSAFYTKDGCITLYPSQSAIGTTIMPGKFHAPRMLGSTFGLEVGLAKTNIATFSVYALYENVLTEEWEGDALMNQGYSAGAKMYLAKIAFPAMAIGFSHNVTRHKAKFSVAFGIGF